MKNTTKKLVVNNIDAVELSGNFTGSFCDNVAQLKRPYYPITKEAFQEIVDNTTSDFLLWDNKIVTFGTADDGFALMPLCDDAVMEYRFLSHLLLRDQKPLKQTKKLSLMSSEDLGYLDVDEVDITFTKDLMIEPKNRISNLVSKLEELVKYEKNIYEENSSLAGDNLDCYADMKIAEGKAEAYSFVLELLRK